MKDKFIFYQEVIILNVDRVIEYSHQKGVIFGIGEDEGLGKSYAVYIPNESITVSLWENEIEPTGKKFKREDFY
ncbi:Imm31 family immunity protein [Photorhabdus tasmaniensis]|uniref:Immunity protein 35 domain-containing protein n=1 Tax=Photorhabdus tasmaniensis TaxID=1004159 RepID=A0ABX0GKY1_9GAMM|nr:Imm31 family immunity protein [Photorhabdus tasmaniensis]NHB89506.1 hypothetical protein [Photorhabdus tasmaniensis]